jgi:hypothetical protein
MANLEAFGGSKTTPQAGCLPRLFLRELTPYEADVMRDKENGKNGIAAIIRCFDCQPEKGRYKCVDSISRFETARVDTIILSPCVLAVCPFKKELIRTAKSKFPKTEFGEKVCRGPLVISSALFLDIMKRILTQLAIHRTHLAG